ncbi:peptidase domain-containing ABC transporter [Spirosoma sp. RP8]|uniref:Peptidase domain-containing ABC transporter n=1 Tax=Spirosoma liriopis TaxID=2937440 RepID=A0ABT0HV72_9BACT|nr:peptidase domain-containing ABC transporter [Spirosoma liriopis]MCK8496081.1 peptidase domain-containing ABC transporter [Spirosoma liriopis]
MKVIRQLDSTDCGPSCLKMICDYYKINVTRETIMHHLDLSVVGTSAQAMVIAGNALGLDGSIKEASIESLLKYNFQSPVILHWNNNHFVVLYKIKDNTFFIANPATGKESYKINEFVDKWTKANGKGYLIHFIKRNHNEYIIKDDKIFNKDINFIDIIKFIFKHKSAVNQIIISLIIGSVLQFIVPFLTKSVVDIGINTKDIDFITTIVLAQIFIFIGRISVEFIRSWILLHLSTRINLQLVYMFLQKLLKLPISFFESKRTGDVLQRMADQSKIEQFLTGTSLGTLFSIVSFLTMSTVLAFYNINVFLLFLASTTLYSFWVLYFQKARKLLNIEIFNNSSLNQTKVIQLIEGINDIKINNSEQYQLQSWMKIQAEAFSLSIKNMNVNQLQQIGGTFLNEGKNILITYLSARSVINGDITLGTMLAIQFIVGQLNNPIEQMIGFIRSYQDAKLSLERLNEVYKSQTEDELIINKTNNFADKDININNLSFSYPNTNRNQLNKINLRIPYAKTTAIVGSSGSGKTTLLKILVKFYKINEGEIFIGKDNINTIKAADLRSRVGVVMQDSYIFSDTIENNISLSANEIDHEKMSHALETANINDFILSLNNKSKTIIGNNGLGISQGQKQRILIARAVFKNPDIVIFDEATNALDTQNESILVEKLTKFFKGRTVIIAAHRLSTIINADQIIVMEAGNIIEVGNHVDLLKKKGRYYELIQHQIQTS